MTEAFLRDVPLLATTPVSWRITTGTRPVMAEFDIPPDGLKQLLDLGGPAIKHTLRIKEGGVEHQFKGLLIIGIGNAENPNIKRIIVADRRWLWSHKIVRKLFNWRRRSGSFRRGDWGAELQPQSVFKFQYANFSLNKGKTWKAQEILKDILTSLDALAELDMEVIFDDDLNQLDGLPVENLVLDDSGDAALARAIALIPGAEVTIQPDGKIRVFNSLSGKESSVTGKGLIGTDGQLGPEIVGSGHVEFDDRKFLRPSRVDVYFSMEVELRFDFLEDTPPSQTEDNPPRYLDNVMPLPDFGPLKVGGQDTFQGTYVTIKNAIDAWTAQLSEADKAEDRKQGIIKNFTFDLINRAMVPGMGFWAALELLGKLDLEIKEADWGSRISALQTHYRQTFRLPRTWMDDILSLRAFLVATIDIVNGQRAPAMAFADYSYVPSMKGLLRQIKKEEGDFYAFNVNGYPGENVEIRRASNDEKGLLIKGAQPAPATVQILDGDQGIIRINYQTDPFRNREVILPAKLVNAPKKNFRKSNNSSPVGFNVKSGAGTVTKLSEEQKVAVLLTAVPASPNSKQQLYRISVTPDMVRDLLPEGAREHLENARGPVKEVRVGAAIETARVRWKQDKATDIAKIFGHGGVLDNPRDQLKDLVINDKEQASIGPVDLSASLPTIARAVAAGIYASEHARPRGSMTGRMKGSAQLEGTMKELSHVLQPNGMAVTQANLPVEITPFDLFGFMDSNTRQIVLKNVQPFE